MAGFFNGSILVADNVDFSGAYPPTDSVTADGELLIGSTVAPNIRTGSLTSTGGTITITPGAGTINLESAGGGGAEEFVVDTGTSPVVPDGGGQITITGQPNFIDTTGSTNTITLVPSDAFLQRTGCQTYNIGLTVSSPTFTINGADGSALSASNPGRVTWGGNVYEFTSDVEIEDSAGTNTLSGNTFGLSSFSNFGSTPIPFYLYVIKDNTTDDIRFALSRRPNAVSSPNNIAYIADPSTSAGNFDRVFFLLSAATRSNYVSAQCWQIGSFFMTFDGADFTFFTTTQNQYGVINADKWNIFPQENIGAGTDSWFVPAGGTAPTMTSSTTQQYWYSCQPSGVHHILSSTITASGVGAVDAQLTTPFQGVQGWYQAVGSWILWVAASPPTVVVDAGTVSVDPSSGPGNLRFYSSSGVLQNEDILDTHLFTMNAFIPTAQFYLPPST